MFENDTVFIHVGYHKTGSTFLQKRVFPAMEEEVDRVITPDCRFIAETIDFEPKLFKQQLQEARVGLGRRKVVLSAETLSGRGDGNPMWDEMEIAARLHDTFGESGRIIAVLRDPMDYIMSLYVFRVVTRGLEKREMDLYLREKFESTLRRKLEYYRLIEKYIELFGNERVLILTYEELKYCYAEFLKKLCDFLKVSVPKVKTETVNQGYRSETLLNVHRALNVPVYGLLKELQGRGLISRDAYGRLANTWFSFKGIFIQPVLLKVANGGPEIHYPDEWEQYMKEVFRVSNSKLQAIVPQDLKALGWIL